MSRRTTFATRLGAIAATVGSAVGLGNIWRFPYEAGQNGGGAFILVYCLCVLFLGIPIIIAEFVIGRSTHRNMKGALKQLSPHSHVYRFAYVCVLGAMLILSFYSVVCGWVVEYLFQAVAGHLSGHSPQEYSAMFSAFVGSPLKSTCWTVAFLVANFAVMLCGVRKGVERTSSLMMPLLFVILVVFCVHSLFLPKAGEGPRFLFNPDFGQLTWRGVVDAFGQAFMSLTLGISGMVTYASYYRDDANLSRDAFTIAGLDTLVAILAGVMIFPAVFSFGTQPEAGPKLIFEILPSIFQHMAGGYVWAVLFFVLIFFASITSTISLSEIPITFFTDEFHWSRKRATACVAGFTLVFAVLSALSFNVLSGVKLFDMNIFDLLNYAGSNVFMLLGGLFTAIYVGWFLDPKVIAA